MNSSKKQKNVVRYNLKILKKIQETLQDSGYFDISRISKEIYEYVQDKKVSLDSVLKRISEDEPWEYIRGYAEFRDRRFSVTNKTLIPRIETEQIVDIAKSFLKKNTQYKTIVDIGTGTGCIVISLALEVKDNDLNIIATDIDKTALEVARKNYLSNKVGKEILFLQTNLIENIDLKQNTLFIANLPYIPKDLYNKLDPSVKDYEPKQALCGGEDGLKYYKELKEQLRDMSVKSSLLIEIEPSTLPLVKSLFKNQELQIFKDFKEKDRFVLIHFS